MQLPCMYTGRWAVGKRILWIWILICQKYLSKAMATGSVQSNERERVGICIAAGRSGNITASTMLTRNDNNTQQCSSNPIKNKHVQVSLNCILCYRSPPVQTLEHDSQSEQTMFIFKSGEVCKSECSTVQQKKKTQLRCIKSLLFQNI